MGFIETLQDAAQGRALRNRDAEVNASKASELDRMQRAQAAMVEAQRQADIAQRARQEGANEVFSRMAELNGNKGLAAQQMPSPYQYTPNADQVPGMAPAPGVNVTNEEVAALKAMGLPLTMDSVMTLRTPQRNSDQGGVGLAKRSIGVLR